MGKLLFYSDQIVESPGNQRLDKVLFTGMEPKQIKVGYLPSTEDIDRKYFKTKVQYYREYGVKDLLFFDLYSEFNLSKIKELMQCDIIHLSAGNPLEFRNAIKYRKMDKVLWDYFNNDGTIVGVSGGAVQLGHSTKLFQLFTDTLGNEDSESLQFVDFEFLPHYNRWNDDFKQKVLAYSQETGTKVYAGNDGDGLIVDGDSITTIGNIKVIGG
ncbi:MAG: Type 1 glutamine amidotransferase-like domain-containing protein [Anaerobacillus sp.]